MNAHLHERGIGNEPDAHVMARHAKVALRWLLLVFFVATILVYLSKPELFYLAAIPIPVLFLVLIGVQRFERRTRASVLRHPGQMELSPQEVKADVAAAGAFTGLRVLGLLALGTFLIAVAWFDWQLVGLAAVVLFMLATLMNFAYLPLFFTQAKEDERNKLK